MSAALLWAESEGWLAEDKRASPAWRLLVEKTRPDNINLKPSQYFHMDGGGKLHRRMFGETCRSRAGLSRSIFSLGLSCILHSVCVCAAISFIPEVSQTAERGGMADYLDVVVIGSDEAAALFEGAKRNIHAASEPPSKAELSVIEASLARIDFSNEGESTFEVSQQIKAQTGLLQEIHNSNGNETLASSDRSTQKLNEPVENITSQLQQVHSKATKPPVKAKKQLAHKHVNHAQTGHEKTGSGQTGSGEASVSRLASSRGGRNGQATSAGTALTSSFRARLIAHLTRYKHYPEHAQERGIGGRNTVTITLTREGQVLTAALAHASGHSILDAATLAAVKRAQPFPAVPEGGVAPFTVTIGMQYNIQ